MKIEKPFLRIFLLAALILCLVFIANTSDSKIYEYRITEKIDKSHMIIAGKIVDVKYGGITKKDKSETKSHRKLAKIEVYDVLRGEYEGESIEIDYTATNEKYKPFICRTPTHPIKGMSVILFLDRELTLVGGNQGEEWIKPGEEKIHIEAIKQLIKVSGDKSEEAIAKRLVAYYHGENSVLKNYAMKLIVQSKENNYEGFSPILIEVISSKEYGSFRAKAAQRLGQIGSKNAFNVLVKYLYDKDKIVRLHCVNALGVLGDKNAIPILLEFIKSEEWDEAAEDARYWVDKISN